MMTEIPETERCLYCKDLLNFLADDLSVVTDQAGVYQGYCHSGHCAKQYKLRQESLNEN